jgi:hypothetical protein
MKSTGNYFYVKKAELKSDFTQIPNALLYVDLSATEKMILAYLLSNAESFRVTNYRIAKSVQSDYRTIKKALKKFRDMRIINTVTNRTIAININEMIRLAALARAEENNHIQNLPDSLIAENNSDIRNSPNSRITDNGATTNSHPPTNVVGKLPIDSGNATTNILGVIPTNNNNQKEIEKEKQKEVSPILLAKNVANEVDDYLKSPSKFFIGNNQFLCSRFYERYRIEAQKTKANTIQLFETVLYYYLLKSTNSHDVQELNQTLSNSSLSLTYSSISRVIQLISSSKEVNDDYKKEINSVREPTNVSSPITD